MLTSAVIGVCLYALQFKLALKCRSDMMYVFFANHACLLLYLDTVNSSHLFCLLLSSFVVDISVLEMTRTRCTWKYFNEVTMW